MLHLAPPIGLPAAGKSLINMLDSWRAQNAVGKRRAIRFSYRGLRLRKSSETFFGLPSLWLHGALAIGVKNRGSTIVLHLAERRALYRRWRKGKDIQAVQDCLSMSRISARRPPSKGPSTARPRFGTRRAGPRQPFGKCLWDVPSPLRFRGLVAVSRRGTFAIAKASVVFGLTRLLSLAAIVTMCRGPLGARLVGTERLGERRALAKAP